MLSRGRFLLLGALVASTISLAACASSALPTPSLIEAGSATHDGTVVIQTAGTYDYVLMTGCQSFKFSKDSGDGQWLDTRGAVQLGPGLWIGSCYRATLGVPSSSRLPCLGHSPSHCTYSPASVAEKVSGAWSLTLSAIGSSY